MSSMHSHTKEQREAVRQLLHTVLVRDMSTFNAENFRDWIRNLDFRFRKSGLSLAFAISNSRSVQFTVKEIRSKRTAFQFSASTRVVFEDRDVVMPLAT